MELGSSRGRACTIELASRRKACVPAGLVSKVADEETGQVDEVTEPLEPARCMCPAATEEGCAPLHALTVLVSAPVRAWVSGTARRLRRSAFIRHEQRLSAGRRCRAERHRDQKGDDRDGPHLGAAVPDSPSLAVLVSPPPTSGARFTTLMTHGTFGPAIKVHLVSPRPPDDPGGSACGPSMSEHDQR